MKKTFLLLFLGLTIYSCSSTKNGSPKTRYFDEKNMEISKSKFNEILATHKLFEIPGDSANHKKLILRENRGKISDRALLESLLEKELNQELDSGKPIVVVFHPGKDACNSSGTASKELLKTWYDQLEDGVNQIAKIKPVYIYKDSDGLKKYDGVLTWYKDPNGTIERLFFKHHYPCGSFVVISKEGDYISYFGEFPMKFVWEATQQMNQ